MSDSAAALIAAEYAAAVARLAQVREMQTNGISKISVGDQLIVYATGAELAAAVAAQQAEVARLEVLLGLRVARVPARQVRFIADKGL
ncbi:hypothetical protein [Muricoccus vinaceus]|uniref:Uncharacterized protein n=1 Tax=Muricoccus vinaceus TaxID=424704 RepID=A0ABV6IM66_9PROT